MMAGLAVVAAGTGLWLFSQSANENADQGAPDPGGVVRPAPTPAEATDTPDSMVEHAPGRVTDQWVEASEKADLPTIDADIPGTVIEKRTSFNVGDPNLRAEDEDYLVEAKVTEVRDVGETISDPLTSTVSPTAGPVRNIGEIGLDPMETQDAPAGSD